MHYSLYVNRLTNLNVQRPNCLWMRSVNEECVDTASKTQRPEVAVLTKMGKTTFYNICKVIFCNVVFLHILYSTSDFTAVIQRRKNSYKMK